MQRRRLRRRGTVVAAAALVAVAAFGVQTALSGSSATSAKDVLIDGTTDSITNLDPAGTYDFGTFTLDANVFEHLLDFANGPKLSPSLATRCVPVGTVKKWSCTLRRGVTFHDGSAFDSADVKWSFDRVVNKKVVAQAGPNSPSPLLGNLKSVQTNGKYAVTFNLKSPQSTWPLILATQAAFIVPSGTYSATALRPNDQSQIGTGPYKLTKYTPGQLAVFERNDSYWGPKAKTKQLIMRYYSKSSTMKLALQRGEVDMTFQSFTPTELASLRKAKGITVHSGNGIVIRYLVFNVVRPPFNNIAVRKAIAYLMPRQAIASRVYGGTVKPLFSMPPAGLPGHIDAFADLYGRTPNRAAAEKVLQKAGVTTPLPIEIWWTPTHYGDASADEYAEIKRALDASGLFKVTLKSAEWAQYSGTLGTQYNAFQLGWYPDYPDAENYIVSWYRNDTFTENGFNDKTMEALIKAELAAKSESKRLAIIRQIQRRAAQLTPVIPVWQGSMIAPARTNVRGIPGTLDAAYIMRFWKLSKTS